MAEAGRIARKDVRWAMGGAGVFSVEQPFEKAALELQKGAKEALYGFGRIFRAAWTICRELAKAAAWELRATHDLTLWRKTPDKTVKGGERHE